jgi:hypothetical protein
MKIPSLLALIVFLFISGCKKVDKYCNVKEPLNDLAWLKTIMQDTAVYKVSETTYKSKEGFLITACFNPDCSSTASVYKDCYGQIICSFGGGVGTTCPDFSSQITFKQEIYSK